MKHIHFIKIFNQDGFVFAICLDSDCGTIFLDAKEFTQEVR